MVFRSGEGALQVLPKLLDVIPEARLNLVIYYLQQVGCHFWLLSVFCYGHFLSFKCIILQEDVTNGSNLMKDVKPQSIPEFILYAIVNVLLFYQNGNVSSGAL